MDKQPIILDNVETREIRRMLRKFGSMLQAMVLFILFALTIGYSISLMVSGYLKIDVAILIMSVLMCLLTGVWLIVEGTYLYKRRKWVWSVKREAVIIFIHDVRSFVKSEIFPVVMQTLLTLASLIALCLGIGWGTTSHNVHYFQAIPGEAPFNITTVISDNNEEDIYFSPLHNQYFYYVIHTKDFTAPFNAKMLFGNRDILSMVCKHDQEDLFVINVVMDDNSTMHGIGCPVVEIRLQQPDLQHVLDFKTAEYASHPGDYYQNNWPLATVVSSASVLSGVAIWLLPFLWRRKRGAKSSS